MEPECSWQAKLRDFLFGWFFPNAQHWGSDHLWECLRCTRCRNTSAGARARGRAVLLLVYYCVVRPIPSLVPSESHLPQSLSLPHPLWDYSHHGNVAHWLSNHSGCGCYSNPLTLVLWLLVCRTLYTHRNRRFGQYDLKRPGCQVILKKAYDLCKQTQWTCVHAKTLQDGGVSWTRGAAWADIMQEFRVHHSPLKVSIFNTGSQHTSNQ